MSLLTLRQQRQSRWTSSLSQLDPAPGPLLFPSITISQGSSWGGVTVLASPQCVSGRSSGRHTQLNFMFSLYIHILLQFWEQNTEHKYPLISSSIQVSSLTRVSCGKTTVSVNTDQVLLFLFHYERGDVHQRQCARSAEGLSFPPLPHPTCWRMLGWMKMRK